MINWLFYGIIVTIVISYLFECILLNKQKSVKSIVNYSNKNDHISEKSGFCSKYKFLPISYEISPNETCSTMCGSMFRTVNIESTHNVFREGKTLSPGRYCLHESIKHCNLNSSVAYLSKATPTIACYSQNILNNPGTHISKQLCHSENTSPKENEKNLLWNYESNKPATTIYTQSTLPNGKLKYRCKCGGISRTGGSLVTLEEFPFHCFEDYCKNGTNLSSFYDMKNKICVCDPNTNNKYFFDKNSTCSQCVWQKLSNSKLQVSLDCHKQNNNYKFLNTMSCGEDSLFINSNTELGCLQGVLDISVF